MATSAPCSRCGECAIVCPAQLQPQQLLHDLRERQFAAAGEHRLLDCSECGYCDLACASTIPLLAIIRDGKRTLEQAHARQATALAARARHRARVERLSRCEQAREQQREQIAASAASADAVAAAVARAAARRAARSRGP